MSGDLFAREFMHRPRLSLDRRVVEQLRAEVERQVMVNLPPGAPYAAAERIVAGVWAVVGPPLAALALDHAAMQRRSPDPAFAWRALHDPEFAAILHLLNVAWSELEKRDAAGAS